MVKPLIVGNWKMHGSKAFSKSLIESIVQNGCELLAKDAIEIVVAPPSIYLQDVQNAAKGSNIGFGLQNVCAQEKDAGAFTGEISSQMAYDMGCSYVLVGHSERRKLFAETDDQITQKCKNIIESGMRAILCVGETLEERERGITLDVVTNQVKNVIRHLNILQLDQLVIAYEPVWAIGTGKIATPEQAQTVHADIRAVFAEYGPELSSTLRILYGGSVKPENARSIMAQTDINGGLIGGASLEATSFLSICCETG